MGAPQHEPTPVTRATVQSLSQFGIPRDQIAAHVGISEPTLRKHYAAELTAGKMNANLKVAKNLYAFASGTKGSDKVQASSGMFWAKTQMGWREQVDVNHQHSFVDGARDRLAAKLGAPVSAPREEETASIAHPIGNA